MDKDNLKPVKPLEREFIHLIVYQGLDKLDAMAMSLNTTITPTNRAKLMAKANSTFKKPNVNAYYEELMAKVTASQVDKAVWTRERSTETLVKLIEKAEADLYGDEQGNAPKQITMSRLNAIVLPVKELNLMNGFNQTNVNNTGGVQVQIIGEDEIPD